jgi:hypothetical protein
MADRTLDRPQRTRRRHVVDRLALLVLLATGVPAIAVFPAHPAAAADSGASTVLAIDGQAFTSWQQYYASDFFKDNGMRCGAYTAPTSLAKSASDCPSGSMNPSAEYAPGEVYVIPVVVHVIERFDGLGKLSDALVESQIDVLNEDFSALASTPGAAGNDVAIRFELAQTDPSGQATTGITHTSNDDWFREAGDYWTYLAWDPSRYMNVYTNAASGFLGYVAGIPQSGIAGQPEDRVVILWSAFGRGGLGGPPYDMGRTLTHEVGHYLGLEHTFNGSCAAAAPPSCYASGDFLCDTPSEGLPTYGCPYGQVSCGSYDPIHNYMDYSDDDCLETFSPEQVLRMRCALVNYRPDLYTIEAVCGDAKTEPGEDCDDGDTSWKAGELCRADCTQLACGDPDGSGGEPTATDALFVLRAAVGLATCDPAVCDVDGSGGSTSATDALLTLGRAVGRAFDLTCPQ